MSGWSSTNANPDQFAVYIDRNQTYPYDASRKGYRLSGAGVEHLTPYGYHNARAYANGISVESAMPGGDQTAYLIRVEIDYDSPHWNQLRDDLLLANGNPKKNAITMKGAGIQRARKCCAGDISVEERDSFYIYGCGNMWRGLETSSCTSEKSKEDCRDIMRLWCTSEDDWKTACGNTDLWKGISLEDMKNFCRLKNDTWWNICGCFYPDVKFENSTSVRVESTDTESTFTGYSDQLNKMIPTYGMTRADVNLIIGDPSCYYRPCTTSATINLIASGTNYSQNCKATGITFVECVTNPTLDVGAMYDNSSIEFNSTCNITVNGTGRVFSKRDPSPTDPAPTDPAPTDPSPTDPAPTTPAPTDPPTDPVSSTDFTSIIIIFVVSFVVIGVGVGVGVYVYRKRQSKSTIK